MQKSNKNKIKIKKSPKHEYSCNFWRALYNGSYTVMAKPMKTLQSHYLEFLVNYVCIFCYSDMQFSTKDNDNDTGGGNCSKQYKGAWWYSSCHKANLNGLYLNGSHSSYADGVNWGPFRGYEYSLKRTEMKIKPKSLQ